MKRFRSLNREEHHIIEEKGTERPHSGIYNSFTEEGIYLCKRCDHPLYLSKSKFSSHCGWPSFDEEINSNVEKRLDLDGQRTEILCASCGGHLGHVFSGEGFTSKNVRHCVNSLSLNFISSKTPEGYYKAYFSGGCFWGVEHLFKTLQGVIKTSVGYCGGKCFYPSYQEVCAGTTGHAETVEVIHDLKILSTKKMIEFFFEIHDPTQKHRQGPDVGTQYRSIFFYLTEDQKKCAEEAKAYLEKQGLHVVTEILPASMFYPAEEHHQSYYEKNGHQPYCHRHVTRFHEIFK